LVTQRSFSDTKHNFEILTNIQNEFDQFVTSSFCSFRARFDVSYGAGKSKTGPATIGTFLAGKCFAIQNAGLPNMLGEPINKFK